MLLKENCTKRKKCTDLIKYCTDEIGERSENHKIGTGKIEIY